MNDVKSLFCINALFIKINCIYEIVIDIKNEYTTIVVALNTFPSIKLLAFL